MKRLTVIRSYKLKPDSGAKFHELVARQSVPLLGAAQTDVVAFGQSLHTTAMLTTSSLLRKHGAPAVIARCFYESAAWRQGPREAILALIEADANAVMWLTAEAVEAMRQSHVTALQGSSRFRNEYRSET